MTLCVRGEFPDRLKNTSLPNAVIRNPDKALSGRRLKYSGNNFAIDLTGRLNNLELIFLERLERRWPGAESVVFCDAVEDVNAAIVKQGGLGNRPPRDGGTDRTLFQGFFADLLYGFEAVAFSAFVFVKRHRRSL